MAFRIQYGGFILPGCATIDEYSETPELVEGWEALQRRRLTVSGEIQAGSALQVAANVAAFQQALAFQNQPAGMYVESPVGSGAYFPTVQFLPTTNALGGVQIVDRNYPSDPMAFATQRSYSVTFEALYPAIEGNRQYLSFSESVSIQGTGGAEWVPIEYWSNDPIDYERLKPRTVVRLVQSGTAERIGGVPQFPPRIYGEPYHQPRSGQEQMGPYDIQRGNAVIKRIQWTYEYILPAHPGLVEPRHAR